MNEDEGDITEATHRVRRQRRREPLGIARTQSPIFNRREGLWLARYVDLVGKERQTGRTNKERIRRYILPYLPAGGSILLDLVSRADLLAVQGALLKRRLSKSPSTARSRRCRPCWAIANRSG